MKQYLLRQRKKRKTTPWKKMYTIFIHNKTILILILLKKTTFFRYKILLLLLFLYFSVTSSNNNNKIISEVVRSMLWIGYSKDKLLSIFKTFQNLSSRQGKHDNLSFLWWILSELQKYDLLGNNNNIGHLESFYSVQPRKLYIRWWSVNRLCCLWDISRQFGYDLVLTSFWTWLSLDWKVYWPCG